MKSKFMQTTIGTFLALLMLFGVHANFRVGTRERNGQLAGRANRTRQSIVS
ncbi:MAG: hypothetical protein WKF71_08700 [Pyrinomonadaceae bacterium]